MYFNFIDVCCYYCYLNTNSEEEESFIVSLKSTHLKQSKRWGQCGYNESLRLMESFSGFTEFDQGTLVCLSVSFSQTLEIISPLFESLSSACHSTLPRERHSFHVTSQAVLLRSSKSTISLSTFARHLSPPSVWPLWWQCNVTTTSHLHLSFQYISLKNTKWVSQPSFSLPVIGASIVGGPLCPRHHPRQLACCVLFNVQATPQVVPSIFRLGGENLGTEMAFMFHRSYFSYLYLPYTDKKTPNKNKVREGRFILVHGLNGHSPSWWGKCVCRQLHGNTDVRLLAPLWRLDIEAAEWDWCQYSAHFLPLSRLFCPSYKLWDGSLPLQQ